MSEQQIIRIPLANLVPWMNGGKGQPRKFFDPQALQELADAIRTGGFIGSIAVRPCPGRPGDYEVLSGHRRTKAAALAHLTEIPATVHDLSDGDARLFVIQDNLNRADFLVWEEGAGYAELVEEGLSIAAIAGKCGKSPSYVSGRIAIHQGLGEKARELYLRKELTLEALQQLAALPDRILSPVTCDGCKAVCPEGSQVCVACGKDLSKVFRCQVGNPQDVAARACIGKTNGAVGDIIERIRESYGLAEKPVQTSMTGLEDVMISEGALKVRTALERRLSDVAGAGEYFLKHSKALEEYTPDQRRAVAAQCAAAIKWLTTIQQAAEPAPAALALAL